MTTRNIALTITLAGFLLGSLPPSAHAQTFEPITSFSDKATVSESQEATPEQPSSVTAQSRSTSLLPKHNANGVADVWVDTVSTSLFADYDNDGYFGGLNLRFDVDTSWGYQDLYAAIYLQLGDESPVELHTTHDFTIHGTSRTDTYRIEAELIDYFQAGSYQIVIDIHDVYSGKLLDTVDHQTHRNLKDLPLESEPYRDDTTNAVVTEYAGFSGPLLLILLAFFATLRHVGWASRKNTNSVSQPLVTLGAKHYEQTPVAPPTID